MKNLATTNKPFSPTLYFKFLSSNRELSNITRSLFVGVHENGLSDGGVKEFGGLVARRRDVNAAFCSGYFIFD